MGRTIFHFRAGFFIVVLASFLMSCAQTQVREASAVQEEVAVKLPEKASEKPQKQQAAREKNSKAMAEYHFAMAQAYAAEGNPDRAIEEYKLTLVFDPESALVHLRLATEYVKKGMVTAAMESCKQTLRLEPGFVDARLMLAGLYSTIRDSAAAIAEYDRVLKQDPSHEEATIYKAQIYLEDERVEEARKTLTSFLSKNSGSVVGWYYLGRIEQQMENVSAAEKAYLKSLDISPTFSQSSLSLGYLYEGQGKNEKAIAVYRALYDINQNPNAGNRLATIYLKQEKYSEALKYLETLGQMDPENLNNKVKLGLVQMELKNFDAAIGTFKDILAREPDSDRVRYYLGSIYEETKQFELAVEELNKINETSRLYEDAVLHTVFLLRQLNREAEATKAISKAIEKEPKIPTFHIFKASLEEDRQEVAHAVKTLEIASKRFPENEKILYYLGSLYDKQGKSERAIAQMEKILEKNPEHADALNYVGYTWTIQGVHLEMAENYLKRALKISPDNAYIIDSWGWYLYVRGRVTEAVIHLEKAVALKPNEATILDHLGDAYVKLNLREKAYQQYREAVRYAQDDAARAKIQGKVDVLATEFASDSTKVRMRSPAENEVGK